MRAQTFCAIEGLADIVDGFHLDHQVLQNVAHPEIEHGKAVMTGIAAQELQRGLVSVSDVIREFEAQQARVEIEAGGLLIEEQVDVAKAQMARHEALP